MSDVVARYSDREVMLGDICWPRSHDTGTYMETMCRSTFSNACNTQTQTLGMSELLRVGVRYFDLRPTLFGASFVTGHYQDTGIWLVGNQGCNGEGLTAILDAVVIAVILLCTATGVGSVLGWAARMTFANLASIGDLLVRALPVLLLTMLVFFNSPAWVMAATVGRTRLWCALGLLYLIAMSTIVVVYAYWPANKDEFERAAQAIIHDEDKPCP